MHWKIEWELFEKYGCCMKQKDICFTGKTIDGYMCTNKLNYPHVMEHCGVEL